MLAKLERVSPVLGWKDLCIESNPSVLGEAKSFRGCGDQDQIRGYNGTAVGRSVSGWCVDLWTGLQYGRQTFCIVQVSASHTIRLESCHQGEEVGLTSSVRIGLRQSRRNGG